MIIIRPSKLRIDAFTSEPRVHAYSQIQDANHFYPKWFKDMPNKYKTGIHMSPTIKKCIGIQNIYQNGHMLPLWSDLTIKIDEIGLQWQYADEISQAECHEETQWEGYTNLDNHYHLKLISPWYLKCKEDVKFYMIQPSWNYSLHDPMTIVKGVVDFKNQHSTHVNMFVDKSRHGTYTYDHMTPMYHLLPITERQLVIKHYLVDEKEMYKFKNRIKFLDNQKYTSQCPFKNV